MGTHQFPAAAPMPAVARILSRYDRARIEAFLSIAIDLLDSMDGDPEAEEEPLEDAFVKHDPAFAHMVADHEAGAYVEWHSKPANLRRHGQPEFTVGHEDAEDDDPLDHDGAEDEFLTPAHHAFNNAITRGAGCKVSDPGGCEHDGREPDDDREREQMIYDVPMLHTYSQEYNIFTDQRVFLGISNLQDSYICQEVRSADTGVILRRNGYSWPPKPGKPV